MIRAVAARRSVVRRDGSQRVGAQSKERAPKRFELVLRYTRTGRESSRSEAPGAMSSMAGDTNGSNADAGAERTDPTDAFVVRLVTHPLTTWLIRKIAAPLDPYLYRATNGRVTTMAPGSETMVTITMTGRKSGKPRSVHLACVPHEGDILLVASAMGQAHHPGWRYNLEAHPECEVQARGRRYAARARVLDEAEKAEVWDKMCEQIPMIHVYEKRTDRNIRVFRVSPIERVRPSEEPDASD